MNHRGEGITVDGFGGGAKVGLDLLHLHQSSGSATHYLHVYGKFSELPDGLTEEMERIVYRKAEELLKDLEAEITATRPENIEWKRQWIADAKRLFSEAGAAAIYVQEIPNQYCGPKCCPHRVWLLVTTVYGPIKIGWRKHVINIDWFGSQIHADGRELFADQGVTKDERTVHAWSYVAAREYLGRLFQAALRAESK